jgi:hypothetical protein
VKYEYHITRTTPSGIIEEPIVRRTFAKATREALKIRKQGHTVNIITIRKKKP